MILRIILWLVIIAAAAEVVAFVLSSIASESEWLLALAFAPALAIIVFRLLRRPRRGYPAPAMATSQEPDGTEVGLPLDVLIQTGARREYTPDRRLEPTRRRKRVERPIDEPNLVADEPPRRRRHAEPEVNGGDRPSQSGMRAQPEEAPRRQRHFETSVNGGGHAQNRPSQSVTRIDDGERASWLGSILWNPPSQMRMGNSERIEVRLGDAEQAIDALCEGLRGGGAPRIDRLEIVPLMRVALTADPRDFSVQALSTQDQFVRQGTVARWDFDVIALRAGLRRLRVLASMRVRVEGKDEVVDLPSYESEVQVSIAPVRAVGQFCAENWKWIAGTIAIPLLVWATRGAGLSDILTRVRSLINLP